MDPIVSVIVPAYNVAPYVAEAVTSALQQTEERIEVIVMDDGSVDGTAERIRSIADQRLRILSQQHSGSAAARNSGMSYARAPYVAFLDADDRWVPDKLERHIAILENNPAVDMTFSNSSVIDAKGRLWPMLKLHPGGAVSLEELIRENWTRNGSAVVVRRKALDLAGPFDTSLPACTDIDMWLRIAGLRGGNTYCLPEVLIYYRRRPGQLSGDWRRMEAGFRHLAEKLRQSSPREYQRASAQSFSNRYRYFAIIAFEETAIRDALRLLWRSIRISPRSSLTDPRTWLTLMIICSGSVLPARMKDRLWTLAARIIKRSRRDTKSAAESASQSGDGQL